MADSTGMAAKGAPSVRPAPKKMSARRMRTKPGVAGAMPLARPVAPPTLHNTESYDHIAESGFKAVETQPLSTFSIDVDTASYSNVRRMLNDSSSVPKGAVRIEEMLNYFDYDYPQPSDGRPFSVTTELADAPWNTSHQLVHIGLQGKRIAQKAMPARNLVFLLDVSGSMAQPNKLPLLKRSLSAMVDTLTAKDRVSIAVYAGASGLVLSPTPGDQKRDILDALERLNAGGSTNGGAGIELAYRVAEMNKKRGGVNRVILATDGDFNVGISNRSDLVDLIEDKRESGVNLTVLGFGMGNYKDSTLETLADKGDGNYAYIDSFSEARKVLIEQAGATLVTIAKDVKIQVEFNPQWVGAYRLIGYDNRTLAAEDFNDDKKDAGEIGAGHSVTALYEVVPPAAAAKLTGVDALKYHKPVPPQRGEELLTVKLRYKNPTSSRSRLLEVPLRRDAKVAQPSTNFRFSAAVAEFGMLLRQSEHSGNATFDSVRQMALGALGSDPSGRRSEFVALVSKAASARR
jgi:Ca-activated chloride channel family protein